MPEDGIEMSNMSPLVNPTGDIQIPMLVNGNLNFIGTLGGWWHLASITHATANEFDFDSIAQGWRKLCRWGRKCTLIRVPFRSTPNLLWFGGVIRR